jgi:ribose 5-phosphate isomerase B
MIYLASDHAGYDVKEILKSRLKDLKLEFKDCGPNDSERVDYPDFADQVCLVLKNKPQDFGILICGSGQGMAMRANKYPFIRAALCWDSESARLSRNHNDANILCLGARLLEKSNILNILEVFLNEKFEGGRHQERVNKISKQLK